MPRILFVAAHRPDRSPSQRYRFEQFVPYWESKGYSCTTAWIIDEADDALFYSPGGLLAKARIFFKSYRRRKEQVRSASQYDLIILQREAFMTGSTRFERAFAASGVPMIYDFDDAIWLMDVSAGNKKLRWLKDPGKIGKIIPMADMVLAGNDYLANYARQRNTRVEVVPTVIDTDRYRALPSNRTHERVVIGWTGSHTSLAYLESAVPMLRGLQERFGDSISFLFISDRPFTAPGLVIENRPWRSATEAEDLADIDIGIMPMPMNEWSKGKCGFKGLQYMGMAKAVVMQDIGANRTIVQHGVNGFLAATAEEWSDRLAELIADGDLRRRMGETARATVEERYSVKAWRDRYLALFNELITKQGTDVRTEKDRAHARS